MYIKKTVAYHKGCLANKLTFYVICFWKRISIYLNYLWNWITLLCLQYQTCCPLSDSCLIVLSNSPLLPSQPLLEAKFMCLHKTAEFAIGVCKSDFFLQLTRILLNAQCFTKDDIQGAKYYLYSKVFYQWRHK